MSRSPVNPVTLNIPDLPHTLCLNVHAEQDLHVSRRIRLDGIWEPYETSLVLSLMRPGQVFVDVGANLGYFSVVAASLVGEQGRVYAFEPDPQNYRLLQENIELNGFERRIDAVPAGLSDIKADGRLYLSSDNFGDHQVFPQPGRSSVPIQLLNGSDYLRPRVTQIDMLKIDTQGAEYAVVAGLMPLLRQLPTTPHILVELTPLSLRQAGASGRALIELLAQLAQPMWIVDHVGHQLVPHSPPELAQWCDDVDKVSDDAGFMNILVGPHP